MSVVGLPGLAFLYIPVRLFISSVLASGEVRFILVALDATKQCLCSFNHCLARIYR